MAARATRYLADAENLLLTDLIVGECVYVLQSFYEFERAIIAKLMGSAIAFRSVRVADRQVLLRALALYERERLHFADAYLVALAERTGVGEVASFDRSIDRATTVRRVEP